MENQFGASLCPAGAPTPQQTLGASWRHSCHFRDENAEVSLPDFRKPVTGRDKIQTHVCPFPNPVVLIHFADLPVCLHWLSEKCRRRATRGTAQSRRVSEIAPVLRGLQLVASALHGTARPARSPSLECRDPLSVLFHSSCL